MLIIRNIIYVHRLLDHCPRVTVHSFYLRVYGLVSVHLLRTIITYQKSVYIAQDFSRFPCADTSKMSLEVTVKNAKKLPNVERFRGMSDPLAILTFQGE